MALVETSIFGVYFGSRYQLSMALKLLAWSLIFAITINVLFVLLLPGYGIESGVHAGSWRATLEHKNYFSRLLVLCALVFRVKEVRIAKLKNINLSKPFFIISAILTVLSTSKTGIVSLIFLILIIFPLIKSLQWQFRTATLFQSMTLLVAFSMWIVSSSNLDYITDILGRDLTLTGRTTIWPIILGKVINERMWLGYGYYGFWHGLNGPSSDVIKSLDNNYIVPHSHNGFIEFFISYGVLGFIVFFVVFLLLLIKSLIHIKRNKNNLESTWPLLFAFFIVIYNLTEVTLAIQNSIFWVILTSLVVCNFKQTFYENR